MTEIAARQAERSRGDELAPPRRQAGWAVVAGQELRDLWLGARGPVLLFAFSLLLSAVCYLAATNQVLNFIEQREAVNLVLQTAVAVGVLVTLVVSADGISGERERGTLEALLLTPVSRRAVLDGKMAAALSVWLGTWLVSLPYLWVLGRGVGAFGQAVLLGLVVGTLLAAGLGCLGLLVSTLSTSNKVSLAVSLFVLLALFAPTQLPSAGPQAWYFDVLQRVNPVASGLRYAQLVLVSGQSWTAPLSYLISPLLLVVLAGGVLAWAGPRLVRLAGGWSAG